MIGYWLSGKIRTAKPAHLDFVVEEWSGLPDKPLPGKSNRLPRIKLTKDRLEALAKERRRSGKAARALLRGAKDKPQGLNAGIIANWFHGPTKAARTDHYEYALTLWRNAPDKIDKSAQARKRKAKVQAMREAKPLIPDKILQKLRAERERTGQVGTLLKGRNDIPKGLSANMISAWLSRASKSAYPKHIDYVLERYAEADSVIAITDRLIAQIERASAHAGGHKKILAMLQNPPATLTAAKLSRIVNRYDDGIAEPLALYLISECENILKSQSDNEE